MIIPYRFHHRLISFAHHPILTRLPHPSPSLQSLHPMFFSFATRSITSDIIISLLRPGLTLGFLLPALPVSLSASQLTCSSCLAFLAPPPFPALPSPSSSFSYSLSLSYFYKPSYPMDFLSTVISPLTSTPPTAPIKHSRLRQLSSPDETASSSAGSSTGVSLAHSLRSKASLAGGSLAGGSPSTMRSSLFLSSG